MHWILHSFSFWALTQKMSLEVSVPRWGALRCCPGQSEQLCAWMRLASRMESRLWSCIMHCLDFNSQGELWILNDSCKLWLDVTQHLWKSGHHPFFTLSHALQWKSTRLFPNQCFFYQVDTTLCCNMNNSVTCRPSTSGTYLGFLVSKRWLLGLSRMILVTHMMSPNYLLCSQSKI